LPLAGLTSTPVNRIHTLLTPLTDASVSPRFKVDIDVDAEPPPPQEPSNRAQAESAADVPSADDLNTRILPVKP